MPVRVTHNQCRIGARTGSKLIELSEDCQDLQAEHVYIRVIDCIDNCYAIIDAGHTRRLIP
jgi:hypothetical protein